MGPSPQSEPPAPANREERVDLFITEAGASRERRCAECGKRTDRWKPVRRRGMSVILCEDCAARAAAGLGDESVCPSCRAILHARDRFCGKCGARLEYACPACGTDMDADDVFCGKCGTQVA